VIFETAPWRVAELGQIVAIAVVVHVAALLRRDPAPEQPAAVRSPAARAEMAVSEPVNRRSPAPSAQGRGTTPLHQHSGAH
jgi:hypothetical protein